jgi:hypothetical protein
MEPLRLAPSCQRFCAARLLRGRDTVPFMVALVPVVLVGDFCGALQLGGILCGWAARCAETDGWQMRAPAG